MQLLSKPSWRTGRVVDVDLLPQVLRRERPRAIALIFDEPYWAGLGVALLLLLATVPAWQSASTDRENMQFRVEEAERRSSITLPREVRDLQTRVETANRRMKGIEQATLELAGKRWPWADLLQVLVSTGNLERVQVSSIAQEETTPVLTLNGTAPEESTVLAYAARLKASSLFSDIVVRTLARGTQGGSATGGALDLGQTFPGNTGTVSPVFGPVPTTAPPPALLPGAGTGIPQAAATPVPQPPLPPVVLSKVRKAGTGAGGYHEIRGEVVDNQGRPVPGLTFRASACCPEWHADYPRPGAPASPGNFEFFVGPGRFSVAILNAQGRGEMATDLVTNDAPPRQYYQWDVRFSWQGQGPGAVVSPTPTYVPLPRAGAVAPTGAPRVTAGRVTTAPLGSPSFLSSLPLWEGARATESSLPLWEGARATESSLPLWEGARSTESSLPLWEGARGRAVFDAAPMIPAGAPAVGGSDNRPVASEPARPAGPGGEGDAREAAPADQSLVSFTIALTVSTGGKQAP